VNSIALIEHWNGRAWSRIPAPSVATGTTLLGVTALSPTDAWAVGQYSNAAGVQPLIEHWNGKSWATVSISVPANYRTGDTLASVAAHGANDIWAVGSYQEPFGGPLPLTEHWNGTKWTFVPIPSTGTESYLDSVSITATNDVWAGGAANNPGTGQPNTLAEHWNGTRWTIVPTPNVGPYTNRINALVAVARNAAWATGDYYDGTAFRTLSERWNGSTWSLVPSPSVGTLTNGLGAIAALSATDILVGGVAFRGSSGGNPLFERWNGAAWSVVPGAVVGGSGQLDTATARSASDIWAVGYDGVEHWDGRVWSIGALPELTGFNDVAEINPTDVWAAGSYQAGGSALVHWNGAVWSDSPHPSISSFDGFGSVTALSPTNVWAAGSGYQSENVPLVEHFDGKTWTLVSIPLPKPNDGGAISEIRAVAPSDIWAVGWYLPKTSGYEPLAEHWNGSTWSAVATPTIPGQAAYFENLSIVSADDIWAVGANGSATSAGLAEHWNGHAWSVIPTPAGEHGVLYGVAAKAADDVWAVGANTTGPGVTKASVLHWNGSAWTSIAATFPLSPNYALYGIAAIPGTKNLLGVGYDVENTYPDFDVPLADAFHC
jgi:hypothetical protein